MAEYIDREVTLHRMKVDIKPPFYVVQNMPAADVAPVVHGRWEPRPDALGFVRCSNCHDCNVYDDWADGKKWNYCPNCGAKMDGGADDENH